jgi:hypothetical protein
MSSLAWIEEFAAEIPSLGGCTCPECMGGEQESDLGPSLASLVLATSGLGR